MKFNIKLNTIKDVEDFTDYANNVNGEIYLRQGRYVVSGKSVMGILSLWAMLTSAIFPETVSMASTM